MTAPLVDRVKVAARTYPQPDGCIGIKILVTVEDEPQALTLTVRGVDGEWQRSDYGEAPDTQLQFGAIYPEHAFTEGDYAFTPPRLVEGARPEDFSANDAPHDPFHGAKPPSQAVHGGDG